LADIAITKGKVVLAGLAESRFKVNADSPALRRLVSRGMLVAGSSPVVLANHFLRSWTDVETATRHAVELEEKGGSRWPERVRYVTVTGGTLLASIPWAGSIEENDGAVEVSSAFLPPCADDAFKVFRGVAWPHHLGLLSNPSVRRYIVTQLERYYPIRRVHAPSFRGLPSKWMRWTESGRLDACLWEPSYVAVEASKLAGNAGTLRLEVSCDSVPVGLGLRAWVLGFDERGNILGREEIRMGHASPVGVVTGSAAVEGFGSACRRACIGFRLDGECRTDEEIRRLEGVGAAVNYSLVFEPGAAGAGDAGDREGDDGGSRGGGDGDVGGGAESASSVTTIHATRVTKKTVPGGFLVGDGARWEWDFGDGTTASDDRGEGTSEMSHDFVPGKYDIRARALDDRGRVTREEHWEIEVPDEGSPATRVTLAAGGPDPRVRVVVRGPVMWVTGRPARYSVEVDSSGSGAVGKEVVTVEPGREFDMVWERPGTFTVSAAAKVRLEFERPGGRVWVTKTYTGSMEVRVTAVAVSD
ncbi:MAG: hypothetical protein NUV93_08670, partial [Firmicutes bacterium]|nr:hypothetical protein [Bacillota bacterium]